MSIKVVVFIALCCFLNEVSGAGSDQDWVKFALDTQRSLISSYSIAKAPLVGTHNSISSAFYGQTFPNQNLSLTAQLQLGVRFMELDLHFIPELNQTVQGPYRMCHSSGVAYTACNNIYGWTNCSSIGIVNYGNDTGCTLSSPNFTQIFNEISIWLKANPANVLLINLDDSITDEDEALVSNMTDTFNGWLKNYFGDMIYTPANLATDSGNWPTIQTLVSRGKSIIFNTNRHTFGQVYIHPDLRGFVWPQSKVKYFSGYPNCTSITYTGSGDVKFGFFQEDLLIQIMFGNVIYNGTSEVGTFNNATTTGVMRCEFTTFYDFITTSSAQALVWSWDFNQPGPSSCGSINPQTGRWAAEDCGLSRYFACRSRSDPSQWVIGNTATSRYSYENAAICPLNHLFSSPRTAKENEVLRALIQTSDPVWISMNKYPNGTWSDVPTTSFGTTSTSSTTSTVISTLTGGTTTRNQTTSSAQQLVLSLYLLLSLMRSWRKANKIVKF